MTMPWLRPVASIVAVLLSLVGHVAGVAQESGCAAYDSQIWAQSVYDRDPGRSFELDPDGNGIACELLPLGAAPALWTDRLPQGAEPVTLASVTDGDTIRVFVDGRNEPVRLTLIDTPETRAPNSPVECFGPEATAYLQWLLSLGGEFYLERDVSERDRYDRLLRYVWLELDGEVYLVNEVMARSGYAALSTYPPDVRYVEQIREATAFAREHGYGLWTECGGIGAAPMNESRFVPSQALDTPTPVPLWFLDVAPSATQQAIAALCADEPVIIRDDEVVWNPDICAFEEERAREYERELEYEAAQDAYYEALDECMDVGCDPDYRTGP